MQLQLHRAVCVGQPLQGLPPQAGVGLEHVRVLGSISSTFYAQLSREAFICADPKPTLIKTACKMLMKLTPVVNFFNIIRTNFSYERRFYTYM